MPKISEFFGITIYLHWDDHGPPHVHAGYAENRASVGIEDGVVLAGELPPRVLGMVAEWVALHRSELREAWDAVGRHETPARIAPLE